MKTHLAALLLLFSSGAMAAPEPVVTPVNLAQGSFQAQRKAIDDKLADGRSYTELRQSDRQAVLAALDRIEQTLAGVASVESIDPDRRVVLFNDQELVNNVLTKAESDSRVVCIRRHKAGSHFKETSCQTVADREQRRRDDVRNMERQRNSYLPVKE